MKPDRAGQLAAWAAELGAPIEPRAAALLIELLERIAVEPQNLTAIEGVDAGIDRHLLDSLVALAHPRLGGARAVVDVGSGAGFPGLALAAARPAMAVTLVESERRKAEWLHRASAAFPNVRVVADRSEHLAAGEREAFPVAVARALGPPPVALELAAPLVAVGGAVVLWRGDADDPGDDADAVAAAGLLGLEPEAPVPVRPFPGARRRLHSFAKVRPTDARYPRRPGRAASRPLGAGARR
ncbi:MAG TPA: RsmG family class I SAM-dependent methyltransferase [Miltoncostaeaceae bacterium]|nr:RsmG family class I SAM-dependent methyltransferase [Miltoncostaeaceae bacterium]